MGRSAMFAQKHRKAGPNLKQRARHAIRAAPGASSKAVMDLRQRNYRCRGAVLGQS
jgi:hypothetical protein